MHAAFITQRRLVGVLFLVLTPSATGCTRWRTTPVASHHQELARPHGVRLTLANGHRFELMHAGLSNDSIVGTVLRAGVTGGRGGAPIDQIVNLEISEFSTGKTLLLAGGVTAVLAGLVALAVSGMDYGGSWGSSSGSSGSMISCPLVYAWDGEQWRLESGTFGGAIAPALARTDVDVLENVSSIDGQLRLRLTNELAETDHVDAIQVVPVEHRAGTVVVSDPRGGVHVLAAPTAPLGARDDDGREMLDVVSRTDGHAWESTLRERDPARTESLRDGLELTFRRPAGATRAWLVLDAQNTVWASSLLHTYLSAQGDAVDAWYASLAAPGRADAAQRRFIRESFLHVSVATPNGWVDQGFIWEAGPEVMKRQAIPLDLGGVSGDLVRVRLTAPPSFWRIDAAALAVADTVIEDLKPLRLVSARSAAGERGALLADVDGREWTMATGDAAELTFADVPHNTKWRRTYVLRSTGWYRVNSRSGSPDSTLLNRIADDPDGMARVSVEKRNAAIRQLRQAAVVER